MFRAYVSYHTSPGAPMPSVQIYFLGIFSILQNFTSFTDFCHSPIDTHVSARAHFRMSEREWGAMSVHMCERAHENRQENDKSHFTQIIVAFKALPHARKNSNEWTNAKCECIPIIKCVRWKLNMSTFYKRRMLLILWSDWMHSTAAH